MNIVKVRSGSIRVALCGLALGAAFGGCQAATIEGLVRSSSGEPVVAAMVTVTDEGTGVGESVFTDPAGRFTLTPRASGALALRLRKPYFQDLRRPLRVARAGRQSLTLTMAKMTSPQEISESLPAAFHFGQIPFEQGTLFDRGNFQRDCLTCHQLGNLFTRMAMPPSAWSIIVQQMHAWLGNFDGDLRARRAELLARGFTAQPLAVRPVFPVDPLLFRAKITQYRLDRAVVPHDAEVNPSNGLVYTVDEGADQMLITDRSTGVTRYIPEPAAGSPEGGKFGMPPLFNMLVSRGPHSLALGPDGKFYVTDAFAGGVSVFNPATEQWEPPHEVPGNALYPHTIRVDAQGVAWFTIAYSDKIGRFDTRTGAIEALSVPPLKPLGTAAVTVPYGLDVNPVDGTVWYARLFADKIGRIDPVTRAITEFDSPVRGPRRLRFDRTGTLWVAGFVDGELARIETAGFKSRVYKLPELAPGYVPAPYALAIEPATGDVWVNEIMTDHVYRFLPKEERFVAYPMPLRGTYTREMSFTPDGSVCMSNNPVPKAALEGGVLELLCIDPDTTRARVAAATILEPAAAR